MHTPTFSHSNIIHAKWVLFLFFSLLRPLELNPRPCSLPSSTLVTSGLEIGSKFSRQHLNLPSSCLNAQAAGVIGLDPRPSLVPAVLVVRVTDIGGGGGEGKGGGRGTRRRRRRRFAEVPSPQNSSSRCVVLIRHRLGCFVTFFTDTRIHKVFSFKDWGLWENNTLILAAQLCLKPLTIFKVRF